MSLNKLTPYISLPNSLAEQHSIQFLIDKCFRGQKFLASQIHNRRVFTATQFKYTKCLLKS